MADTQASDIGLLLSGGLDSSILLAHLLEEGRWVQPFYVRAGLHWETAEQRYLERFLAAVACERLAELVAFDLPLADLYQDHWSVTGQKVPDAATADEAVYLPGRNALLVIKAALWCQLHGIGELALASLGTSPFADATAEFFAALGRALSHAAGTELQIVRPFAAFDKRQVMRLGRELPLEWTFSCISPAGELHCGRCNKCAERKAAFRATGMRDSTKYEAPTVTA